MNRINRKICPIAVTALLLLSGCGSETISKDPADFTAATRVEAPEADTPGILSEMINSANSVPDTLPENQNKNKKKNEYGLYDQYFLDSYTNKFNLMISERHFTADVNYYEAGDDGKWYFWYNERNEINGRDRHQQTLEDPDSGVFDKDIYYLKDTQNHYCAYGIDWDKFTYSVLLDVDAEYENKILDQALSETLFYGIDDLETAVYMGYMTDETKGLTVEQFMIEDVVYSFTYDKNGILKDSRGNGKRAKVRSFENSCPPITIPKTFKYKE